MATKVVTTRPTIHELEMKLSVGDKVWFELNGKGVEGLVSTTGERYGIAYDSFIMFIEADKLYPTSEAEYWEGVMGDWEEEKGVTYSKDEKGEWVNTPEIFDDDYGYGDDYYKPSNIKPFKPHQVKVKTLPVMTVEEEAELEFGDYHNPPWDEVEPQIVPCYIKVEGMLAIKLDQASKLTISEQILAYISEADLNDCYSMVARGITLSGKKGGFDFNADAGDTGYGVVESLYATTKKEKIADPKAKEDENELG